MSLRLRVVRDRVWNANVLTIRRGAGIWCSCGPPWSCTSCQSTHGFWQVRPIQWLNHNRRLERVLMKSCGPAIPRKGSKKEGPKGLSGSLIISLERKPRGRRELLKANPGFRWENQQMNNKMAAGNGCKSMVGLLWCHWWKSGGPGESSPTCSYCFPDRFAGSLAAPEWALTFPFCLCLSFPLPTMIIDVDLTRLHFIGTRTIKAVFLSSDAEPFLSFLPSFSPSRKLRTIVSQKNPRASGSMGPSN